jgi:hypothetical protein
MGLDRRYSFRRVPGGATGVEDGDAGNMGGPMGPGHSDRITGVNESAQLDHPRFRASDQLCLSAKSHTAGRRSNASHPLEARADCSELLHRDSL